MTVTTFSPVRPLGFGGRSVPKVVAVTPTPNAVDVAPVPRYSATLSTARPRSFRAAWPHLRRHAGHPPGDDGGRQVLVNYQSDTLLAAGSIHQFVLTFTDNATPPNPFTHEVPYMVVNYLSIQLPAPLFFENFDTTAEGQWPTGWTETNYTEV